MKRRGGKSLGGRGGTTVSVNQSNARDGRRSTAETALFSFAIVPFSVSGAAACGGGTV